MKVCVTILVALFALGAQAEVTQSRKLLSGGMFRHCFPKSKCPPQVEQTRRCLESALCLFYGKFLSASLKDGCSFVDIALKLAD